MNLTGALNLCQVFVVLVDLLEPASRSDCCEVAWFDRSILSHWGRQVYPSKLTKFLALRRPFEVQ